MSSPAKNIKEDNGTYLAQLLGPDFISSKGNVDWGKVFIDPNENLPKGITFCGNSFYPATGVKK